MPRAKAQPYAKPKASPFAQRIVADMRERLVKELGKPAKPIALHEMIRVDDIWQAPDQRPIDPRALDLIMETIRVEGLQSPVLVQKTKPPSQAKGKGRGRGRRRPDPAHDRPYELVYGGHRLEAFRRLGHKRIPARILPENANKEEVYRLSILENLARAELSPLQRDEAIRRWMSSTFYAFTRRKLGLKGVRPKNQQPRDKGISQTTRELAKVGIKVSRRTVGRAAASIGLTPAARDYAINHGLDKNWPLLREASKLPTPKQQIEALEKVVQTDEEHALDRLTPEARDYAGVHFYQSQYRSVLRDISQLPEPEQLKALEKIVSRWMKRAFDALTPEAKDYASQYGLEKNGRLLYEVKQLPEPEQVEALRKYVSTDGEYVAYIERESKRWQSELLEVWNRGRAEWRAKALEKLPDYERRRQESP